MIQETLYLSTVCFKKRISIFLAYRWWPMPISYLALEMLLIRWILSKKCPGWKEILMFLEIEECWVFFFNKKWQMIDENLDVCAIMQKYLLLATLNGNLTLALNASFSSWAELHSTYSTKYQNFVQKSIAVQAILQ